MQRVTVASLVCSSTSTVDGLSMIQEVNAGG
jgi:hypothetical protein